MFLPKTFIGGLYNSFDMDMPELFENLFNRSLILAANDSLPEGLDPSTVAAGRTFLSFHRYRRWSHHNLSGMFSNNGVAHSLWSLPVNTGAYHSYLNASHF